jgi:hypothetical protein
MQHLNLYSQVEQKVEPPFSARHQLVALAVLAAFMLLLYGWLSFDSRSLQKQYDELAQNQKIVSAELGQLEAKKIRLTNSSNVDEKISQLKANINFRRQLLSTVNTDSNIMESGFAAHLQGLARQHVEGMWFNEIHLQKSGKALSLSGKTLKPEYVPRYIQKLAQEEVFQGHRFRVFRMSMPEQEQHLLQFELRAAEVGAVDLK